LFAKGIGSIVEPDIETMVIDAESELIRLLLVDREARLLAKSFLDVRSAMGQASIAWSTVEKEWLVTTLCELPELPSGVGNVDAIRSALEACPGAPTPGLQGADEPASTSEISEKFSSGEWETLDCFFEPASFSFSPLTQSANQRSGGEILPAAASFRVQQLLSTLFQATTERRIKVLRAQAATMSADRGHHLLPMSPQSVDDGVADSFQALSSAEMVPAESDKEQAELGGSANSAVGSLAVELNEALQSRIPLQSPSHGAPLLSLQTEVANWHLRVGLDNNASAELDSFMNLAAHQLPSIDGNDHAPREEILNQVRDEWGEWCDDDFVWTPDMAGIHGVSLHDRAVLDSLDDDSGPSEDQLEKEVQAISKSWERWETTD
jgi:hypothetical protein